MFPKLTKQCFIVLYRNPTPTKNKTYNILNKVTQLYLQFSNILIKEAAMKATTRDYTTCFKIQNILKAVLTEKLSMVNSLYNFHHFHIIVPNVFFM